MFSALLDTITQKDEQMPKTDRYPFIMRAKEKHGDYFYVIDSAETEDKVCAGIIKERAEQGYWYLTPEAVTKAHENAITRLKEKYADKAYFDVDADTLPEPIKTTVEGVRAEYSKKEAQVERNFRIELAEANMIAAVVNDTAEPGTARKVLWERSHAGYEYETIEDVRIENPEVLNALVTN